LSTCIFLTQNEQYQWIKKFFGAINLAQREYKNRSIFISQQVHHVEFLGEKLLPKMEAKHTVGILLYTKCCGYKSVHFSIAWLHFLWHSQTVDTIPCWIHMAVHKHLSSLCMRQHYLPTDYALLVIYMHMYAYSMWAFRLPILLTGTLSIYCWMFQVPQWPVPSTTK